MNYLLVALGGALGSVLRYMCGTALNGAFPYGTLTVNIVGCFAIGFIWGYGQLGESAKLFLMVGVLGGFTTFSAFSLDTLRLVEAGQMAQALAYVGLSVILSLFAVFGGLGLVKALS